MTTLEPAYTYLATAERWVDGDTVYLKIDVGFRMTVTEDFRLYGIDTPERGHGGYQEAKDRVNELAPVGSTVLIKTYRNPGKYGRWLVDIYPHGSEISINDMLVTEGLAVPYFGGKKKKKSV